MDFEKPVDFCHLSKVILEVFKTFGSTVFTDFCLFKLCIFLFYIKYAVSPNFLFHFANKHTFLIYLVPQCLLTFSFVYINFYNLFVILYYEYSMVYFYLFC